jgi:hypothetical protein
MTVDTSSKKHRIFFLASIAGGSGDITFAAETLSILLQRSSVDSIFLGICKQASGDVALSFLSLKASIISLDPTLLPSLWRLKVKALRLFERRDRQGLDHCQGERSLNPLHDVTSEILLRLDKEDLAFELEDLVLFSKQWNQEQDPLTVACQCPLRVISSSIDLFPFISGHKHHNEPVLRLVTIREFGQARFSTALSTTSHSTSDDVDVSAGLGQDELGIFGIDTKSDVKANTEQRFDSHDRNEYLHFLKSSKMKKYLQSGGSYACGYFRTVRDALPFGRSLALFLSSAPLLSKLYVFLPIEEEEEEEAQREDMEEEMEKKKIKNSMFITFFIRGLLSTELFSIRSPPSDGTSSSTFSSLQICRSTTVYNDNVNDMKIEADLANITTIYFEDSMSLSLPLQAFRAFLSESVMNVVTGDMTLNEALVNKKPFFYSMEGHKLFVKDSLYQFVKEKVEVMDRSASIVAAFWEFIERRGSKQQLSSLSFSSPSSPSSSLSSINSEFSYSWTEIQDAFLHFSTQILIKYGHLGDHICQLMLS